MAGIMLSAFRFSCFTTRIPFRSVKQVAACKKNRLSMFCLSHREFRFGDTPCLSVFVSIEFVFINGGICFQYKITAWQSQ